MNHEPAEAEAALSLPAVIEATDAGAPGSASEVDDVRDNDAEDDIASADGGRGTSP